MAKRDSNRDPVQLPEELLAVAVDTNSTGRDLQLRMLSELSNVMDEQELDSAEIWVPEPVLWEWAEHAHDKLQSIETTVTQLGKIGLPSLVALDGVSDKSVSDIVEEVTAALEAISRVRILRLTDHPEAAIDGLRDQVLKTGAGKLKGADGTKTGAADSASFRLIAAEATEFLEDLVVLVSNDVDATTHYASAGVTPIVIRDWDLLRQSVLTTGPTRAEVKQSLETALRDYLKNFIADTGKGLPYDSLDGDLDRALTRYDNYAPERDQGVSHLDRIGPVEVQAVSRKGGYASARVDVTLTIYSRTIWYDPSAEAVDHDEEVFTDVPAIVGVWAVSDDDAWEVAIETVFVPDEGSDEAYRVAEAVDSREAFE